MTELQAYELIERYLNGNLSDSELQEFEHRLLIDPILAERAKQYHELTGALHTYGQRTQLKRKLAKLHQQLETQQQLPAPALTQPGKKTEQATVRQMWRQHAPAMGVA